MGKQLTSRHSFEQQRRWMLYCPGCGELWFVLNVQDGDEHVCKGCGHRFITNSSLRPRHAAPTTNYRQPLKRAA